MSEFVYKSLFKCLTDGFPPDDSLSQSLSQLEQHLDFGFSNTTDDRVKQFEDYTAFHKKELTQKIGAMLTLIRHAPRKHPKVVKKVISEMSFLFTQAVPSDQSQFMAAHILYKLLEDTYNYRNETGKPDNRN